MFSSLFFHSSCVGTIANFRDSAGVAVPKRGPSISYGYGYHQNSENRWIFPRKSIRLSSRSNTQYLRILSERGPPLERSQLAREICMFERWSIGKAAPTTSCLNATYVSRSTLFAGAETGLQWLPLRVPGNVRLIVTATHPDPNYLQLHEQKIRQHMMMHPHQGLTSQSSRASSVGDGGDANATTTTTQSDCMGATIQEDVDTKGDGEAEYESSHRRRKVCRPADECRQKRQTYSLHIRFPTRLVCLAYSVQAQFCGSSPAKCKQLTLRR